MTPRSLVVALAFIALVAAAVSEVPTIFRTSGQQVPEPFGAAFPWLVVAMAWMFVAGRALTVASLWRLPSTLYRVALVVGTLAVLAVGALRSLARGALPGVLDTAFYELGVVALISLVAFALARTILRPVLADTRPPVGARDIAIRTRWVIATGGAAFATAGILLNVLVVFEATPSDVLATDLLTAAALVAFSAAIGWVVGNDSASVLGAVTRRMRQLALDPAHTSRLVTADEVGDLALAAEEVERRVRTDEALAASTAERERIARELHDGVAKSVSVLSIEAAALSARAPAELRPQIARVERLAALLAEELRAIVRDVRTRGEMEPFAKALERAVAAHANTSLRVSGDADALEPLARFELLRILDEALRNADRHADAAHVVARLDVGPDDVSLCVEDDGKGIEAVGWAALASAGHFGLLGMRERAELLDGDLRVERRTEGGTRVAVRIPRAAA